MSGQPPLLDRITSRVKSNPIGVSVILVCALLGLAAQFSGGIKAIAEVFTDRDAPAVIAGIELPAYVVLDSAWATKDEARRRLVVLSQSGYTNTGFFWIPDFEYLSGKSLWQVYVGPFRTREAALDALRTYNNRFHVSTYALRLSDKPGREELRCPANTQRVPN